MRRRWLCIGAMLALCLGAAAERGAAAPTSLTLALDRDHVGKYQRAELRIGCETMYANPFDPADVRIDLAIDTPSGRRLTVPAFLCQEYERGRRSKGGRPTDWYYPVGKPIWKARFAPMEEGAHHAVAILRDRAGSARSPSVRFICEPSQSKGFLRTDPQDSRYLALSEGVPFFGIGQNLAFIGSGGQYVDLTKAEQIFDRLEANGANFIRVWTCCEDWAMAIEARKSAWGRSWDWHPPIVADPDDGARKCLALTPSKALAVSPSHPVALRPGTRYRLDCRVRTRGANVQLTLNGRQWDLAGSDTAEAWRDVGREFTTDTDEYWLERMSFTAAADAGAGETAAWLDGLTLQEADEGPNLLWEADVNRPVIGYYNPVDSFMLDELVSAAEARGIYLQLCMLTRDLYMPSLKDPSSPAYDQAITHARDFFRYAVARWGYSAAVGPWEYFNEMDPGLPTDRFYRELGAYLADTDVYGHLRTTSTWGPSAKDCRHPALDIAEVHYYFRPTDYGRERDEVTAALGRRDFLREHAPRKPAVIGEFGLATDKWGLFPGMKADKDLVHFHNALWASALSGASSTVLFWWWEEFDRMDAYGHYRPLAAFLADASLADLAPVQAAVSGAAVDVVGLAGPDRAYLWLFNPQGSWRASVDRSEPLRDVRGARLQLAGLTPGARYRAQWWDTRAGRVIASSDVEAPQGTAALSVPAFLRDLACKLLAISDGPAQSPPER